MYQWLGLTLDDRIIQRALAQTGAHNRAAATPGAVHTLARNSRGLIDGWRSQLSPRDAERINELAAPVGQRWYGDAG